MSGEAGFSLLEVVVATAVFGLGATAMLNVLGESQRSHASLETRAIARIVAENHLVEVMATQAPPPTGVDAGKDLALDRTWLWERRVGPSPQAGILRIDVAVREAGRAQIVAELSSFRASR
ncbi:MAG: type II secretion system minor pseudopilin GspI [Alphaproteobacteria bacterium]|nr:type II secretion system minor pseudopilin GspI [Alphaproteobacteria bacterium]